MNIYTFLNEIFFVAFEAFNIILLFLLITNKKSFLKECKMRIGIFIMLYTFFAYFILYFIPIGYHTLLIIAYTIITLSLITRSKIRNSVISYIIVIIFIIITEFPVAYIFSFVTHKNISDIIQIPSLKLFMSAAVKTIQLIIIIILFRSKKLSFNSLSEDSENSIISYFVLGICLMSIFVFNIDYIVTSGKNIIIYEFLLFTILLLYIFLGFMIMKENEQLIKIQHKYHLQEAYVKNIETILNILRREKHDFANHINTVHAMCLLNKPDAVERIKAYIDKLACNLHASYHYYNTGNDYVDGLLAVKSNFAFEHNIHLEVDFEALLDNIAIDAYDLISILGNIIDNAFEAVMLLPNHDEKIISVCSYIEKAQYYLSIANNGPPITHENLERIFTNGFSTKQDHKADHGLGLFIVKQLIEKNTGSISVTSSTEETMFLIIFDRWNEKNGEISKKHYQLHSTEQS